MRRLSEPTYTYDEMSDTVSISFAPGVPATGIELTDHIILRVDMKDRRAIGLTLLDYSLVAQTTKIGSRSFPLTGLADLTTDVRDVIVQILKSEPVRDFITLSAYTPSGTEQIPIISIQPLSASLAS
jgi:hypothetical protein